MYSDLGAIITDDVDTNIGYTVSLDNATSTDLSNLVLDTSVGGTHYIVFTAADQAGNVSHATRTVIVGDGSTTLTTGGAGEVLGSLTSPVSQTYGTSTPPVVDTTPLDTQSDLTGQAATSTDSTGSTTLTASSSPQAATSTTP